MSLEDLCNQALKLIGYSGPEVGSLANDASPAALACLEHWGETRDEMFHLLQPSFALRNMVLTLVKSAPPGGYFSTPWTSIYPPIPWLFEYAFPTDCIVPLQITPADAGFIPMWKPKWQAFRLNNPPSGNTPLTGNATTQTILSNTPNATLAYIGQILDPNNWHEDFTIRVVAALAKKLEPQFGKPENVVKRSNDTSGRSEPGAG